MSGRILLTEDVSSNQHFSETRDKILRKISNPRFPCTFSRKAAKDKTILWGYHDRRNSNEELIDILISYTNFIRQTAPKTRLLSPLIVIFDGIDAKKLEDQQKQAWEIIQSIHYSDPMPWPTDIPLDPNDSNWCFCFNGVQLFINVSLPGYTELKTRNLGNSICFVINPREVFDLVAPSNSAQGKKVRQAIRAKIPVYNNTETYPKELGFFSEKNNKEWKQYILPQSNQRVTNCPLKISRKDTQYVD